MNPRPHIAEDPASAVRASARIAKVCELLDCDESQVRRLLDAGEIEGYTLGGRAVRVFLDSVALYQNGHARAARRAAKAGEKPMRTRMSAPGVAAHRSAMRELQKEGLV